MKNYNVSSYSSTTGGADYTRHTVTADVQTNREKAILNVPARRGPIGKKGDKGDQGEPGNIENLTTLNITGGFF
ncbi:hypothetical protein F9K91_07650 [Brucella tritici]|uniref:Uncharacterized protein n=1 Tax=Brucella tritici TaxID=94626 RepID=A0A833CMY2_9HYPH|nr:hypothetical protein [Brucella tritici]KAB2665995.1 hypothetical protein F9K91_07650 [Brucella tritici]